MTPLHRIEERLHALTFRQAVGLVAGANLFLVALALALPADGQMRGPALLSILGNFHILALHIPAAVLLVVPLFEFFERHEQATATVRRLSVFSAAGTWAASRGWRRRSASWRRPSVRSSSRGTSRRPAVTRACSASSPAPSQRRPLRHWW